MEAMSRAAGWPPSPRPTPSRSSDRSPVSQLGLDAQPGAVVVAPISSTTTSWLVERPAPPVHADVGEQAVLDLVPLAGPGRQMTDRDGQSGLGGEACSSVFHSAHAVAVAASARPRRSAGASRPGRPADRSSTTGGSSPRRTRRCRGPCPTDDPARVARRRRRRRRGSPCRGGVEEVVDVDPLRLALPAAIPARRS